MTLDREELFQFLGEVALPPWEHASGEMCGSDIDCAPIAQKLSDWVDSHTQEPGPNLGYATTRQLLSELTERTEVDGSAVYRTIDGG